VLARAAREPGSFVLGLDANTAGLVEASRRTWANRGRGVSNAAFVAAAVERIPDELVGRADLVTVTFPWGSLLRGVLGLDRTALAGVSGLLANAARLEVLVSLADRDLAAAGVARAGLDREELARAWRGAGLELTEMRTADRADVDASGSTWAKRLLSTGSSRPVTWLAGRRSRS
jgi:16S rRNA (adenine(1408)-N(1))-methyltransferase